MTTKYQALQLEQFLVACTRLYKSRKLPVSENNGCVRVGGEDLDFPHENYA